MVKHYGFNYTSKLFCDSKGRGASIPLKLPGKWILLSYATDPESTPKYSNYVFNKIHKTDFGLKTTSVWPTIISGWTFVFTFKHTSHKVHIKKRE